MSWPIYSPVASRVAYEEMESQRDAALYKLATERGRCATLEGELKTARFQRRVVIVALNCYMAAAIIAVLAFVLFR